MQFTTKGKIMGVKKNKGTYEGNPYDYTRVIIATDLDTSQGNALGQSSSEYDYGTSENFSRFQKLTLPVDAEMTVDVVTSGRSQKLKLIDFKPLGVSSK